MTNRVARPIQQYYPEISVRTMTEVDDQYFPWIMRKVLSYLVLLWLYNRLEPAIKPLMYVRISTQSFITQM